MCHGDLMDKNILLDTRGNWWAIDPRPCVGDPCLDAAFWSVTHRPGERVKQRCELVARAAGLNADRVWAWALVFAVSEAVLVTDRPRARAHHRVLGGG
jgi:streptomycin 6-kinase